MRPYRVITRADDLGPIANEVREASVIGLDIETYKDPGGSPFDPRRGQIRLVQLNIDDRNIYVIDLMQTQTLEPVVSAMRATKAIFIAHNAKFEQKWFWYKYKLKLWPIFCTYRGSVVIYNGKGLENDLWSVYERELGIKHEAKEDHGKDDWSVPNLTKEQYDYAAEDVVYLPQLRLALKEKLARDGLLRTALIEFGVLLPEGDVELNGFPVDQARWLELAERNRVRARELKSELLAVMPHPKGQMALPGMESGWNLDSSPQLIGSLGKMGIKVSDTNKLTLSMLTGEHPIIKKIMEYRKFGKRYSSFGPDWLRWVQSDGRIHSDYFALLATGRYSNSNPNLQQCPREPDFRKCFRAPPGKIFILADYAGIEMRIVAEISKDPRLIQVFIDNRDVHTATAALVTGKPESAITKAERQDAKPANFGFIYGLMPEKFVIYAWANYGVAMSLEKSERFHKKYFSPDNGYYGVKLWHQRALRDGQRHGVSRAMSGRVRYMGKDAYNEFYNNPVQSTGSDALKIALCLLHDKLEKYDGRVKIVHHVHDEIILESDDEPELVAAAKEDLCQSMTEAMQQFLKVVPVLVEPSTGYSWGEAKSG